MAEKLHKLNMSMAEINNFFRQLGLGTDTQRKKTAEKEVVKVTGEEYSSCLQIHFHGTSEKVT